MFERYTEKARRVIFFARYEASLVGSPEIGDEHLLIGLMREDKGLLRHYIGGEPSAESIRAAITAATVVREPTSTSVDLPLNPEAKRFSPMPRRRPSGLAISISAPNICYWEFCARRAACRRDCCGNGA